MYMQIKRKQRKRRKRGTLRVNDRNRVYIYISKIVYNSWTTVTVRSNAAELQGADEILNDN